MPPDATTTGDAFDAILRQEERQLAAFRRRQLDRSLLTVEQAPLATSGAAADDAANEDGGRGGGDAAGAAEPPSPSEELDALADAAAASPAPDVLLVQLCDHMQHDQGVKRHAVTVTFGSDGFRLADMCRTVRRDLRRQLAGSYWQMHQTHERSAFFVCTRVSHGTADMMIASMTQRVVAHSERFGYRLQSSYVTLSPDVQHTSVRMLYHYFIFRRSDEAKLIEAQRALSGDGDADDGGRDDDDDNEEEGKREDSGKGQGGDADDDDDGDAAHERGRPTFRNFEPPRVGPQEPAPPPVRPPREQRVKRIWGNDDDEAIDKNGDAGGGKASGKRR
jgi:hypothetical protein